MISRIEVGEGWTRYKQREPVVEGTYYRLSTARGSELTKEFKKAVGALAVSDPAGRFHWLLPFAPWVKRVLVGLMDFPTWSSAPRVPVDWSIEVLQNFGARDSLRTWQREFVEDAWNAVAHGLQYRRAAVVPLGGGKTLAGLLLCAFGNSPVVFAPKYLHETWISEARKFRLPEPRLCTYESAHKVSGADVVVVDEALALKDPEALRSRKIREASRNAEIVVGFTGTPTGARGPLDWRWLCSLVPGAIPDHETRWRFLWGLDTELKEVAPGRDAYVTKTWDLPKIATFVSPFVLAVDTSSLASELPELSFQTLRVSAPKEFERIKAGVASDGTRSKVFAQARQCSDGFILLDSAEPYELSREKLDAIEEFVEATGEPVVVMANWDHSVSMLAQTLASYEPSVIRGGMSPLDLEHQITRFKDGRTSVLIANARFSQGMNLQERSRILVFMSWSTNPVDRQQAIGRIYRPGQRRGCVVVDVIAEDTLDARTVELITKHTEMSATQIEALLEQEIAK